MTPPNHRNALTADEAAATKVQYFCNNCFKAANELIPDGQFPVCNPCLTKREANRKMAQ